jgi:ribose 5-phosphate isomerase A
VKEENLDLVFIPSSFQSQQVLLESGLKLSTLTETPILDIVFDGADEIDCHLDCIKGGGGCLTLEKINASCSKKLVIIADHSKLSSVLGEKVSLLF